MDIGERLRRVRNRANLSQRQLAKRAGITNSTISLVESNRTNPSVGALKRILDAVPVSLAEFFALDLEEPHKVVYAADELVEIGKAKCRAARLDRRSLGAPCRFFMRNMIQARTRDEFP